MPLPFRPKQRLHHFLLPARFCYLIFFYMWLALPIRLTLLGGRTISASPIVSHLPYPPKSQALCSPHRRCSLNTNWVAKNQLLSNQFYSSLINFFLAWYHLGTAVTCMICCGDFINFIKYDVSVAWGSSCWLCLNQRFYLNLICCFTSFPLSHREE